MFTVLPTPPSMSVGIEQQRRLDRELERRGLEIHILRSSRRTEAKIHHAKTPRFRNYATNFRLSRIFVIANICTNRCDISASAEEVGWHVACLIWATPVQEASCLPSTTHSIPSPSSRRLAVCGQHVSEAEHEHAALALRCEPAPSEDKRYEGVVASAVMRRCFRKTWHGGRF